MTEDSEAGASPWEEAMWEHICANQAAGRKPDSWRSLHLALAALSGSSEATWKKQVGRWRRGTQPTEANVAMLAEALGVPRDELPQTEPLNLQLLARRLREHEDRIAALEEEWQNLDEFTERLKIALGQFRRLVDEPQLPDVQPPDGAHQDHSASERRGA